MRTQKQYHHLRAWIILWGGFGLGVLLSLSYGSVNIPLAAIFKTLSPFGSPTADASFEAIVLEHRLPRFLTAWIAGASLGIGGLLMQTFFRNPLAGPGILGISSASGFGAAAAILVLGTFEIPHSFQNLGVIGSAFLSALILTLGLLLISMRLKDPLILLIIGLMASYAINALVSVMMTWSDERALQKFILWGLGSFAAVDRGSFFVMLLVFSLCFIVSFSLWDALNLYLIEESVATSSGVHGGRMRILLLLIGSLLTATITAFCGPIAFLGVASPHLSRFLLKTSNHFILLPFSALMGSTLAIWSDWIARLPGQPGSLPLNAVLSMMGAPVIVYLMMTKKKGSFP